MKPRYFLLLLSSLLIVSLLMANFFLASEKPRPSRSTDFYVGIDAAYDDVGGFTAKTLGSCQNAVHFGEQLAVLVTQGLGQGVHLALSVSLSG